jgi:hypothetical protein
MSLEKQLAQYIKTDDLDGYAHARYPAIGEGEELVFRGEDFTGVDFSPFVLGFMVFKDCLLDGAIMQGQPITIIDSSAKNLDIRGRSAVIVAFGSDFRGLKYNEHTLLAKRENGEVGSSHFYSCQFDKLTRRHFVNQGVVFM